MSTPSSRRSSVPEPRGRNSFPPHGVGGGGDDGRRGRRGSSNPRAEWDDSAAPSGPRSSAHLPRQRAGERTETESIIRGLDQARTDKGKIRDEINRPPVVSPRNPPPEGPPGGQRLPSGSQPVGEFLFSRLKGRKAFLFSPPALRGRCRGTRQRGPMRIIGPRKAVYASPHVSN
jgi:hypothetical protein